MQQDKRNYHTGWRYLQKQEKQGVSLPEEALTPLNAVPKTKKTKPPPQGTILG
jgi:hypothetical protein